MSEQREFRVRVPFDGNEFVGRMEERGFSQGGHEIVVYYKGRSATDKIAPEMYYPGYVDFCAGLLLKRLVEEEGNYETGTSA